MSVSDDPLVFLDEEDDAAESSADFSPPWRILVVDDDGDVHETSRFALSGIRILGRPLSLLHAMSGREALEILRSEGNIAVILLDVVMESEDAGLRLVDVIRSELKLVNTRIILRTGQPGHAPECETIARYDINDYKTKSELTQEKLFASLTSAIRSYDQLLRLDANRRGLEKIVAASNQFIADQGLQAFAEGVITQIAGLLGVEPEGLVCAAAEDGPGDGPLEYRVIAAAGHFSHLIQRRLSELDDPWMASQLAGALRDRHSLVHPRSMALYFRKSEDEGFAAFIDSARPIREVDRELLEVFCTNIALCAKNVDLVAELRRDAFVDRQMGLPNRTALVCALNARLRADGRPGALAIVDVDQFASANDMLGQELMVEHPLALGLALEHDLHHALDQRQVAADPDVHELAGDLGGPERRHLHDILGLGEPDQRTFRHRIDGHDGHLPLPGLHQVAHHARRIRARVLADDENRFRMLEVVEHDGALANTDRRRQPAAGRLMAHVGAVGEVVGAELAHEDRIQEGRLVGRAARRVELRLVRALQRAQVAADGGERLVPAAGNVMVGRGIVAHGLGQPPLHLQPVVGLGHQFGDGVLGKELTRCPVLGGLPRKCLGAVLAELELLGMVRIGKRTAGALEAAGLVHRQQRARSLGDDALFEEDLRGRRGGAPAAVERGRALARDAQAP